MALEFKPGGGGSGGGGGINAVTTSAKGTGTVVVPRIENLSEVISRTLVAGSNMAITVNANEEIILDNNYAISLSSLGTGEDVGIGVSGSEILMKSLIAGNNITLTSNASEITINAANITTSAAGTGISPVKAIENNNEIVARSITATNIDVTIGTNGEIVLSAPPASVNLVLNNSGTGVAVISSVTGETINARTLIGSGLEVSANINGEIILSATPGITSVSAKNLGTGEALFLRTSGNVTEFYSLTGGNHVTLTNNGTDIVVNVSDLTLSAAVGGYINFIAAVSGFEIKTYVMNSTESVAAAINNGIITASVRPVGIDWNLYVFDTTNYPTAVGVSGAYNNSILVAEDGVIFEITDVNFSVGNMVTFFFEGANGVIQAGTGVTLIPGGVTNVSAGTTYSAIKKASGIFLITGTT